VVHDLLDVLDEVRGGDGRLMEPEAVDLGELPGIAALVVALAEVVGLTGGDD